MKHVRNVVAKLAIALTMLVSVVAGVSAETCQASWYSSTHTTANGQHVGLRTVAHKTHRFGTHLRITNLANRRSVVLTVNDRGPYIPGRCVDLSPGGRDAIGMGGVARVSVEVVR